MGRPTKQGVDYFPLDVQFNNRIELFIVENGALAVSVLVTIWQLIYQNEGYYIKYSDELLLLVKRRIMLEPDVTDRIVMSAIKRGVFDKEKFDKYGILTSKSIQERYFIASKKKKKININKNYLYESISDSENYVSESISDSENALKEKEEEKEKEKENTEKVKLEKSFPDFPTNGYRKELEREFIRGFKRNPGEYEIQELANYEKKYGMEALQRNMRAVSIRNIRSVQYFFDNIDEQGNLIPFKNKASPIRLADDDEIYSKPYVK